MFADRNETAHRVARAANNVKQSDIDLTTMSLKQATDSVNRYCTCNENICNCCRDFHIPLVQLKGPGNYHATRARKMKVRYGNQVQCVCYLHYRVVCLIVMRYAYHIIHFTQSRILACAE